ncbi:MAG: hypothetical protein ACREB9_01555 [Thermoplasmata archaeon]
MRWTRHYLPELVIAAILGGAITATLVEFAYWGITPYFAIAWDIATVLSISIYFTARFAQRDLRRFALEIVLLSVVVAAVGFATGLGGVATDEGRTTPYYGQLIYSGINPYTYQANLQYTVTVLWGAYSYPVSSISYDTYLPLISFIQIPGTNYLGYDLLCVAAWAGMVYLVRNDDFAVITLGSPVVILIAVNGFNDMPLLFLMTLSLRGWTGPKAKAVEYATYAMKQFANGFWILYYLARRDWLQAVLVLPITILLISPFLLWDGTGIYCNALTFGWGGSACAVFDSTRNAGDLWGHWNYYLWPVWIYALFRTPIDLRIRWVWARLFHPRVVSPASNGP